MKRLVYRALCSPRLGLPWLENMRLDKPLRTLRGDLPDKMRLERWYYFWINRVYTDPMVLIHNGENWWTVHPGMNRWIAASLRPPQDYQVLLVSKTRLKKWPKEIHSVKINNLSKLIPYAKPQPKSEDWLNQKPKTTWDQWYEGYTTLAKNIRQSGQGSLALADGNKMYTMGEGPIVGCWPIKDTGIPELTSLFTFADSLGWNRL